MAQSAAWCFTLNNYTEEDVGRLCCLPAAVAAVAAVASVALHVVALQGISPICMLQLPAREHMISTGPTNFAK